jgi:hypothetical protein
MIIEGIEYVSGVFRGDGGNKMVTHLYQGTFGEPGHPMCSRGWQRKYYDEEGRLEDWEYSIFRNNWTNKGLCKVCERRANAKLPPIKVPYCKKGLSKRINEVIE